MDAPLILPSLLDVFSSIVDFFADSNTAFFFWRSFFATFARVLSSFFISLILGSAIGILSAVSPSFKSFIAFPLSLIRSTPVVALILIALFWFGSSSVPVFAGVLMALPVVSSSFAGGLSKIDRRLLRMAKIYGLSKSQIFGKILIPSAIDSWAFGSSAAFGLSWKVVAAGEVLSLPKFALGSLMQTSQVHLETADVMALALILVFAAFAVSSLASLAFKLIRKSLKNKRRNLAASILLDSFDSFDSAGSAGLTDSDAENQFGGERISLSKVNFSYADEDSGEKNTIFTDFSLDVEAGCRLAILGRSGEGKTTLLNLIAGQYSKSGISYAFQTASLIPNLTLLENVALPLKNIYPEKKAFKIALETLKNCGLYEKRSSFPDEISGGEKVRASVARAIAFPGKIMLFDESLRSLDLPLKLQLLDFLSVEIEKSGRTALFVTHDIREALAFSDRVLVLSGRPAKITGDFALEQDSRPASEKYSRPSAEASNIEGKIFTLLKA